MCEDLLCDARRRAGKGNGVRSHGVEVLDRSINVGRSTGETEERVNQGMDALENVPVFGFSRNRNHGGTQSSQEFQRLPRAGERTSVVCPVDLLSGSLEVANDLRPLGTGLDGYKRQHDGDANATLPPVEYLPPVVLRDPDRVLCRSGWVRAVVRLRSWFLRFSAIEEKDRRVDLDREVLALASLFEPFDNGRTQGNREANVPGRLVSRGRVLLDVLLLHPIEDVRLWRSRSEKRVGPDDLPCRDVGGDLDDGTNAIALRNELPYEENALLKTGQSLDTRPIERNAPVTEETRVHVQILSGRCDGAVRTATKPGPLQLRAPLVKSVPRDEPRP